MAQAKKGDAAQMRPTAAPAGTLAPSTMRTPINAAGHSRRKQDHRPPRPRSASAAVTQSSIPRRVTNIRHRAVRTAAAALLAHRLKFVPPLSDDECCIELFEADREKYFRYKHITAYGGHKKRPYEVSAKYKSVKKKTHEEK